MLLLQDFSTTRVCHVFIVPFLMVGSYKHEGFVVEVSVSDGIGANCTPEPRRGAKFGFFMPPSASFTPSLFWNQRPLNHFQIPSILFVLHPQFLDRLA